MKSSTQKRIEKKALERNGVLRKNVFSKFYGNDMTLEKAKAIISPYVGVIAAQSRYHAYCYGDDIRSPLDTYDYQSEENILIDLFYISDRFDCQFRLDWTLGILDKNLNKL
jgi:hypothetical protein